MSYEISRQMHIHFYGSFLYCKGRDTLCEKMNEAWKTGIACTGRNCILDDPRYQKEQENIEKNRRKQIEKERAHRQAEKDAAPIRDQRNRIKNYVDKTMDEIHRLEEESQKAYHNNKPKLGDELFNKAKFMRVELYQFQKRGEENDQRCDQEANRRDDENQRPAGTDGRRTSDQPLHQRVGSTGAARAREILKGAAQENLGRNQGA